MSETRKEDQTKLYQLTFIKDNEDPPMNLAYSHSIGKLEDCTPLREKYWAEMSANYDNCAVRESSKEFPKYIISEVNFIK